MSTSPLSHRLRAHWVFPVAGPPIEDGVVTIEDGRIVGLSSGPDPDASDLGEVAIIPGLVNAHTHLEFSDLTSPLSPAGPFPDWIRALVEHRRQGETDRRGAIDTGLRESAAAGCTLVGEIATDDVSLARTSRETPKVVAFREVLGIDEHLIDERVEVARAHLKSAAAADNAEIVAGISPHAPYSLSAESFRRLVDVAVEAGAPVAMHLAETQEELLLLTSGTGPLVDMLKEFGVWREQFWMLDGSIAAYLEVLSQARRALVVHGNYLTEKDIDYLATQPQMTVVYCLCTHRYFGHRDHPWRRLLDRGANVALGTDSRASNPDLSLWREIQYLRETCDDVPAETLLDLATLRGATALGMERETGTLSRGKSADLTVVALCEEATKLASQQPTQALLHPGNRITATMQAGRWIHR